MDQSSQNLVYIKKNIRKESSFMPNTRKKLSSGVLKNYAPKRVIFFDILSLLKTSGTDFKDYRKAKIL
jgi:hypothetical protein